MFGCLVLPVSKPACTDPRRVWLVEPREPGGVCKLYFKRPSWAWGAPNAELPCAKCLACRHAKAGSWANRVHQEARLHEVNVHLTLTYAPEHYTGQLEADDIDLYLDRLRIAMKRAGLPPLRYFLVGEYGDQTERGHFHMVVFGADFAEWSTDAGFDGEQFVVSEKLCRLWGKGHVYVSPFGEGTAAYVAAHQWKAYEAGRKPFMRCSKKPPIGYEFLRRYADDFLRNGFVTDGSGTKQSVPSHYFTWKAFKDYLSPVKAKRRIAARERKERLLKAGFTPEDFERAAENQSINLRARSGLKRSRH